MTRWDDPWSSAASKNVPHLRETVSRCDGDTRLHGKWTAKRKAGNTACADSSSDAVPMRVWRCRGCTWLHRTLCHATSRGANGRVGCLVYLVYHARACEICDMRAGDSQRLMFVYPFLWRWFRLVRR